MRRYQRLFMVCSLLFFGCAEETQLAECPEGTVRAGDVCLEVEQDSAQETDDGGQTESGGGGEGTEGSESGTSEGGSSEEGGEA